MEAQSLNFNNVANIETPPRKPVFSSISHQKIIKNSTFYLSNFNKKFLHNSEDLYIKTWFDYKIFQFWYDLMVIFTNICKTKSFENELILRQKLNVCLSTNMCKLCGGGYFERKKGCFFGGQRSHIFENSWMTSKVKIEVKFKNCVRFWYIYQLELFFYV